MGHIAMHDHNMNMNHVQPYLRWHNSIFPVDIDEINEFDSYQAFVSQKI